MLDEVIAKVGAGADTSRGTDIGNSGSGKSEVPDPSRRRCFVISPIGKEGSDVRKHADDVFHCIIEPAAHETGYAVMRGDHSTRPGRITNQIVKHIMDDDLIICVLTGANPNVYYELAIAESAARPIVVLKMKDEPTPFDVKDTRTIEYDLDPQRIFRKTYVQLVVEAIRALEGESDRRREVPFAPKLSPLGSDALFLEVARQYSDVSHEVLTIAAEAVTRFDMCGLTLNGWSRNEPFTKLLTERAKSGCKIRLLIMDEKNPALKEMINRDSDTALVQLRDDIQKSFDHWTSLARQIPNFEVRKIARGIPHQQVSMNETRMVWTPYMFRYATNDAPAIQVYGPEIGGEVNPHAGGIQHLFTAMQKEIEHLWWENESKPAPPPRAP
jgi:hypothetical protein